MDVKGKITIFPRKVAIKNEDGSETIRVYCSGSISTKIDDEKYLSKSVDVSFSSKAFPEEKLLKLDEEKCYTLEIEDGFLKVNERLIKGQSVKEIGIMVTKGKLIDSKKVERKEKIDETNDDLPF